MPDSLFFSLWFRQFDTEDMLSHLVSVMRQFPFSALRPGTTYWPSSGFLDRAHHSRAAI